jgi:hypothetical protein
MTHVPMLRIRRFLWALGLTGAFAACGSGLNSGAWAWCKQHLDQVDAAAAVLQLPVIQTTIEEPTWWPNYVTSMQNTNTGLIAANPDFLASCNVAADANNVGASRVSWCLSDGIGPAWTGAVQLNLITQTPAETYAYRSISLEQRLDNPEFIQACQRAYAPPPSPAAS